MILLQCDGMSSWINGCKVCIPGKIGSLVSTVYNAILIAVPLLLIISGMFSLASAIMKQKEEDVKKAQQLLVKKLIAGAIVFLLFALVKWLVSYFDNGLTNCFDALINYNKDQDVCEIKEDGTVTGGANCAETSKNEYWDINNGCKLAKADGAVRNPNANSEDKFICYVKDYENCSCTDGDPFKYTESITHDDCDCWCAKQTYDESEKQYIYSAFPGTCN